jgi:tetratricopeptide (TPR) repeat protein
LPPESSRIAELRRRVEADPSSIAFAQLAEEYRRAGNYAAAEQVCRTGLTRHPGYLSARVTLGRTLIELDKLEEGERELEFVLKSAPDNLAAIRGMGEIHQRRGHLESALDYYHRALPLARHDPEIEETVRQINRDLAAARGSEDTPGLSFAEAQKEFLAALAQIPAPPDTPAPDPEPSVNFDGLLKSLGNANHQAPPIVEALLAQPASQAAPPEPVLPELPVETPANDPFADLERGLRALDHPAVPSTPAPLGYGEVAIDAAPSYGELATADAPRYGEVALPDPAPEPEPPTPSALAAQEPLEQVAAPEPVEQAAEQDPVEQTVLAELEAWLDAIKR